MQRGDFPSDQEMKKRWTPQNYLCRGLFLVAISFATCGVAHSQSCYPAPADRNLPTRSLYVVAGQSNAVGLATVKDFVSGKFDVARKAAVYKNVKIYGILGAPMGVAGNDDDKKSRHVPWSGYAQWHAAQAGFGYKNVAENSSHFPFGVTASDSFGPELSLAYMLNDKPPYDHYIAKLAVSNTALHHGIGADNWSPSGRLYAELLRVVAGAHNSKIDSVRLSVAGIFFMQGETDALHENWAKAYKGNIQAFVEKIRGDLYRMGCTEDPTVPLVIGRVQDNKLWTYRKYVRSAQNDLAQLAPKVEVVDTDSFSGHLVVGGVHFDEYAQFSLGKMAYQAFAKLDAKNRANFGPGASPRPGARSFAIADGVWQFHCCDAKAGQRWLTQDALPMTYRYDGVCKSASCAVVW